jgi:hypothetical protein
MTASAGALLALAPRRLGTRRQKLYLSTRRFCRMVPDESREQGVEFGSLDDELAAADYPMSKEELLERHGDRELELEDGSQTLREVLEPLGETTFESADDVKQSVMSMVSDEAIGRKKYSDRGGQGDEDEGSAESA